MAVILVVVLVGLNILQAKAYQDDRARRDTRAALILDKLDKNQDSVLCYTTAQSKWNNAVTDLLTANVDPNDATTSSALATLASLKQQFDRVSALCFEAPPDADG